MNLSIYGFDGNTGCRPDTTLEFEDRDFYIPESVDRIDFAPAIFIRMTRAGKCISPAFAERYYEAVCPGLLLYASGHPSAALFDHSSIVPRTFYSKHTLEEESNVFELKADGCGIFHFSPSADILQTLDTAITRCSEIMSQRTGDLVVLELQKPSVLCTRDQGTCEIEGSWCDNPLFSRAIIF